MAEERLVTEVSSSLKQLARLIVRGFYTQEDTLIIDMLVRNSCMKEDDMCELLKFDKKMLRARIFTLKNDKFIQVRLRMETDSDGKTHKVNCYFINYKSFVNVIKYKLDMMRKKLETQEKNTASRASFKCPGCLKTFTDLEADQLFDFETGEFRCTYCRELVEEEQSSSSKKGSRLLLAKFNEQLEPLYVLLREVEGIKLAPEVLEPKPMDINAKISAAKKKKQSAKQAKSVEATTSKGFLVEETSVNVTIGDDSSNVAVNNPKEVPIWMTESTIFINNDSQLEGKEADSVLEIAAESTNDDIMSVLIAHEKRGINNTPKAIKGLASDSDSSCDEMAEVKDEKVGEIETIGGEEEYSSIPTVTVGNKKYDIMDINDAIVAEMTQAEKEVYVQIFQDCYSDMSY